MIREKIRSLRGLRPMALIMDEVQDWPGPECRWLKPEGWTCSRGYGHSGPCALSAPRTMVPVEQHAELEDYFGCLLATGHSLEETLQAVADSAAGRFGSMD